MDPDLLVQTAGSQDPADGTSRANDDEVTSHLTGFFVRPQEQTQPTRVHESDVPEIGHDSVPAGLELGQQESLDLTGRGQIDLA